MIQLNMNMSDREIFEYLIRIALDAPEIKQQLIQLLTADKMSRKELLEVLLRHTKLQYAPAGMRNIFIYFQDDLFAKEVLQYLQKS
ncbi:MAG: hypothetical protein WCW35_11270 [Bacteroidota bacterium]